MPIFEYHCLACDKTFEKLLKAPADDMPCPVCGQAAGRTVSVPAAHGDAACAAPATSGFR